jgi:hypothetical protein
MPNTEHYDAAGFDLVKNQVRKLLDNYSPNAAVYLCATKRLVRNTLHRLTNSDVHTLKGRALS